MNTATEEIQTTDPAAEIRVAQKGGHRIVTAGTVKRALVRAGQALNLGVG